MKHLYQSVLLALTLCTWGCEHRPLHDTCPDTEAQIPVAIDWSESGINPTGSAPSALPTPADYVHRVSIRFFPKNGSPAFDRYLEGDVLRGVISLPVGSYSVVAFNEALDDPYWDEAIRFSDTDSYERFAAHIVAMSPDPYDFYTPRPDEQFVAEPFKLASWSLDTFEVTPQLVVRNPDLDAPDAPVNALTKIVMRRLTRPVRVVVEVTNLKSAIRMEGAHAGLSSKVYLASGLTESLPATHLFAFTAPVWSDQTQSHGTVERTYLAFGALPAHAQYSLELGVVFVTGEDYQPDQPLRFDVTQQVEAASAQRIEIRVPLVLPEVSGGIHVGDWDDTEITIQ